MTVLDASAKLSKFILAILIVLVVFCVPKLSDAFANLFQSSSISIKIQGIDDNTIIDEFTEHSKLEKYKNKKIASYRWLEKLIKDDKKILIKLLQSHGHYGAHCTAQHRTVDEKTTVVFIVEEVEQYKYKKIEVNFLSGDTYSLSLKKELVEDLHKLKGEGVDAKTLDKAFSVFKDKAAEAGFPFAKIKDHCLIMDTDPKMASLVINISLGKRVFFGRIDVSGSPSIPHSYIRNRAPWCRDSLFQRTKLNEYQDILYRTELFDRVSITANEDQIEGHNIQIDVNTKESKQRSIYAAAEYSLGDGAGAKVGWEHRNLTGQADKLSPNLTISQREQEASVSYILPDFWKIDTWLKASVEVQQSDTKAYKDKGAYGFFSLETRYNEHTTYFYGVSTEKSKVKRSGQTQDNLIFGFPVGLTITDVNSLLNPTEGFKFSTMATPEIGVIESDQILTQVVVNASHYFPVTQETTWANRIRAGSILGASNKAIPADHRFYAGGGGSVRAYAYQLAGPLDSRNKPLGGRSILDGSTELRQRLSSDWGVVAFFDGAYVMPKSLPSFKKDFYYGVGAGIRYYTDFGPIRLDVAVPLKANKDSSGKNINRPIQFYISIGQSF